MRLTSLAPSLALGASLLAFAALPQHAIAQQGAAPAGPTPVLTLEEAIGLARRNNPGYLQAANDRSVAAAGVRSAYGAFIPSVDASLGGSYREGGQQFFAGNAIGASGDIVSSSYDVTARLNLSPNTITGPRQQRAQQRAVEADVNNAGEALRSNVTQQYVTVLQRQAQATLQESLLVNVRAQLELARARVAVGAATALDEKRAEVQVGQQEVALVRARNDAEVEMLRLFQLMGVQQPQGVQLTTRFELVAPTFTQEEVLEMARRQNPQLRAAAARETAARTAYRASQGQYLPTLSLQASWGGFANQFTDDNFVVQQQLAQEVGQCQQIEAIRAIAQDRPFNEAACNGVTLSPDQIAAAKSGNRAFPFDFTRSPFSFYAGVSLPIFNGLQREQRVQEANAQRADARYAVRAQELRLTADVTAAYLSLTAARRTSELQTQNAATAREALRLAEERYRVGANTFVDVQQARADYERAETDRISAVYDYHRAFAALEAAVGRPLR